MKIKESAKIGDDKAKIKEECKECSNTRASLTLPTTFHIRSYVVMRLPVWSMCIQSKTLLNILFSNTINRKIQIKSSHLLIYY